MDVECQSDRVSVTVRDQGLGIPLHEQREIFDRFVRGAGSKARRIKGTGIGLAMVREIVQAHGGEIRLTSEPGRGSRFTITLRVDTGCQSKQTNAANDRRAREREATARGGGAPREMKV